MIIDRHDRRLPLLVLAAGLGVTGWLVLLPHLLPGHYRAAHWRAAWVGLDAVEAAGLLAAGTAALRGRAATVPATVAATALGLDAWFDVCTAASTPDVLVAVAMAVLGELPLAIAVAVLATAAGSGFGHDDRAPVRGGAAGDRLRGAPAVDADVQVQPA